MCTCVKVQMCKNDLNGDFTGFTNGFDYCILDKKDEIEV